VWKKRQKQHCIPAVSDSSITSRTFLSILLCNMQHRERETCHKERSGRRREEEHKKEKRRGQKKGVAGRIDSNYGVPYFTVSWGSFIRYPNPGVWESWRRRHKLKTRHVFPFIHSFIYLCHDSDLEKVSIEQPPVVIHLREGDEKVGAHSCPFTQALMVVLCWASTMLRSSSQ